MGYFIENDLLKLFVKDTGIGISPRNHQLIFERFSQEDKEISRKHGGLGLGLSISKENAQLLGGDITLQSEKDKGSTFYVTIPFNPAQTGNDKTTEIFITPKETDSKYTILIAEDEEVNYLYLEALLGNQIGPNYNLIHAINGREAVNICVQNKNIDLVLMDIKMPIMNGYEATEIIKSQFPDLPIIAQTAYSKDSDRELAMKHGCVDFISKPINKEKLIEMINKYWR
jgi:CheY-like chemotaxis protein